MIMLIVLGFLTGVLFGLRFKVIILVPIIMLAWALTITIDAMHGVGFWWIVLDMFVLSTALQVGYWSCASSHPRRYDILRAFLRIGGRTPST